jgi:hypothetical protein
VTDEPIHLVPALPIAEETRQQAVKYLEEALEMAKSGDFDAACIILFRPNDGGWHYDTTGTPSILRLIGALEIIKQKMIDSLHD